MYAEIGLACVVYCVYGCTTVPVNTSDSDVKNNTAVLVKRERSFQI